VENLQTTLLKKITYLATRPRFLPIPQTDWKAKAKNFGLKAKA